MNAAFDALWSRLGAAGDPSPVHADLARRYAEPHRAYHTLAHIEQCLGEIDRPHDAVEWAIWFHDAVYDPRASDNEHRSARLSRDVAERAGLSREFADVAEDLILATRHDAAPVGADAALLVDIDLSILGRPDDEFDAYDRAVRIEYSWVPDAIYGRRRAKLLRGFLERPRIFVTQRFFDRYEATARSNLARIIREEIHRRARRGRRDLSFSPEGEIRLYARTRHAVNVGLEPCEPAGRPLRAPWAKRGHLCVLCALGGEFSGLDLALARLSHDA